MHFEDEPVAENNILKPALIILKPKDHGNARQFTIILTLKPIEISFDIRCNKEYPVVYNV